MPDRRWEYLQWVNAKFPPASGHFHAGVYTTEGEYQITREYVLADDKLTTLVSDFYYVNRELINKAREMGLILEWTNPDTVVIHEGNVCLSSL